MHNKPFYGEAINKKLKLSFLTIKCDILKIFCFLIYSERQSKPS